MFNNKYLVVTYYLFFIKGGGEKMSYQEHLEKYRETISNFTLNLKQVKICLDSVLDKIKFLEDIYQTGGKHRGFSQSFKDSAFKEREELCQESSALYTILKEDFNYVK